MSRNLLYFDKLSLSERNTYISYHGKYIGFRLNYNHVIHLYLLDETFFEVWCFPPEDSIVKVEPLHDYKKIDLYIKHMTELVNI